MIDTLLTLIIVICFAFVGSVATSALFAFHFGEMLFLGGACGLVIGASLGLCAIKVLLK